MLRALRALRAVLLALAAGPVLAAQAPSPITKALPKTGVDFTGIDAFYSIADILVKDVDPTDEQWGNFLLTPGYVLLWQQNRNIRVQMALAFKPSRKVSRDSVLAIVNDNALGLKHLIRAYEQRDAVMRTRAALERSIGDSITRGVAAAARFLPKGTVDGKPTPFIGFAVFGDDGYALNGGILLDPLFVKEEGLLGLISHEFHHIYAGSLDRTIAMTGAPPYDAAFAGALRALRNEGIADQIDKPHPLPPNTGALAFYVTRYNETYDKTPAILKSIDSLLVVVHDDSTKAQAAGPRARQLLWSNSHPNGAYMARTILETFGVDSLMPALPNFFAFIRTYASAEVKRGNPPPFSPKAVEMLDNMEKRYIRALPKTGIDYTGIDQFYAIADILRTDAEPSEPQWQALLGTPGYQLVAMERLPIRTLLRTALKPSLAARRDSMLARDDERASSLSHIMRAAKERDVVMRERAALERTIKDSIAAASPRTAKYLPPGTLARFPTPLIAFAIYGPDGFTEEQGIVLDPLYVVDVGIVDFLAHEFHHAYSDQAGRLMHQSEFMALKEVPADVVLFLPILRLRTEGIADLIDKTYPLRQGESSYVAGYNAAYARTPQVLHVYDSLAVAFAANPKLGPAVGRVAGNLFRQNGHPNGAYMARTIVETFGIDSLMPGIDSPMAFMRAYAAAEVKRGHPAPFSPATLQLFAEMEKHYLR